MRARDVLQVGVVGLRTRRLRSALTAVGISIGIAAMVAVLGISASSRADVLSELDALGTNLLVVTPGQSFLGDDTSLPDEAAPMIRRVGPVTSASGVTAVSATVRRTPHISESETGGIGVYATEPELLATLEGTMRRGRFLDDATAKLPAVVLGATTAERLAIDDLDSSPMVWLGGRWYAVVGILDPLPLTPDVDRGALIGYERAARDFDTELSPSRVFVRTVPSEVDAVRNVLPQTASPEHTNEVQVDRPSDTLAARAATNRALTALLVGLGAVALVVGGVGIANVMVISVLERRGEIGIRRALGATKRHVRIQFLLEAVALAFVGGTIGVLAGALVTVGYVSGREWTVAVPLTGLVAGIGAALVIGAIAGLYSAARAARLAPADAVRPA